MPWLSILMALLSFFSQKRDTPEQKRKAALVAGLVGAGTYYVSHETEWGREHLGQYDGVITSAPTGTEVTTNPDGTVKSGLSVTAPPSGATAWDVLKAWGPTGTAAVIGTTTIAASSDLRKWLLPAGILLGIVLLVK